MLRCKPLYEYYEFTTSKPKLPNVIYVFWTCNNKISDNRLKCLKNLEDVSECKVILVNTENLSKYILPNEPLHEAYEYLSCTHKADYLRTYFMHFYGGGYSDIKMTTASWLKAFYDLEKSDKWINGYQEIENGVAYGPIIEHWRDLVGNVAYICEPQTPLTMEWYQDMLKVLDIKLEKLKKFPSTFPQDRAEISGGKYPIEWNEMLGRIFHRICFKYKDKLLKSVPISIFTDYR